MASGIKKTVCFLTCLALTGCASQDLMVKRQSEAEAKIEHLIQADKKSTQRMNELSGQIQTLDEQTRSYDSQIKQLQASIRELRTSQSELAVRALQPPTPKIEVVNQDVAPKNRESGPPAEYVKAFGLYSSNNFSAAIEAFQAFLAHAPKSDYAANAVYWTGECHYSLNDLSKSLASFQKVVDLYPGSTKVPDALLKLGYTQAAMKERDKSVKTFEELIRRYPSSPAAAKARERLTAN
ncbi:MAG: tol-pal system protein YbgF [Desulfuromonadales bacterium]|nr:tol-pal system protein YbgF [Desulfuromonadales bacterium]